MLATIVGKAGRRDPTTFIGSFSMWAILCGIALIVPGDIFKLVPQWKALESVYPDENVWGIVMLVDGLLLQASLFMNKIAHKSAIAGASAVLWMMVGVLTIAGAWLHGVFSIVGAFSVWGSIGCFMAITQWVYTPGD